MVADPMLLAGVMLILTRMRHDGLATGNPDLIPLAVVMPVAALCLHISGAYLVMRSSTLTQWIGPTLTGCLLTAGVLAIVAFVTKTGGLFSRSVLLLTFLSWPVVMLTMRFVVHRLRRRMSQGSGAECVILAGPALHCFDFAGHLDAHPWLGLRVVGLSCDHVLSREGDDREPRGAKSLIVRNLAKLEQMVRILDPDRVILCSEAGDEPLMRHAFQAIRERPITLQFAPDFSSLPIFSFRAGNMAGRPVMDLSSSPLGERALIVKWLEDKLLGLIFLVISLPIMLVAAILIFVSDPGPVVFTQWRHGLHGRPFRVFKLRTMRMQPVEEGVALEPKRHSDRFHQAQLDDPRITWIGRWLRRLSIDELPQLFNVLRGDMSLVGPRPHAVAHNQQFAGEVVDLMRRHYVKPGITGLAQISGARGRTNTLTSMQRRVDFDLEYIKSWSLWLDMKIILLTAIYGIFTREP